MADRTVRAGSFVEAQLMVPFPVQSPPGKVEEISVRPESGEGWATVRSVHRVPDAVLRVKQLAFDWLEHFGWPVNLWHSGLGEHRWDTYGPTTHLEVGPPSAFHGRDYEGKEAGSLVSRTVHLEFRVIEGQLGPQGMADIFRETHDAASAVASVLAGRPLCLWNWVLTSGGIPMWHKRPSLSRFRWYGTYELGQEAWGEPLKLPDIAGWRFDSWGVARLPSGARTCCILLRSDSGHSVLSATYQEGIPSEISEGLSTPLAPLFRSTETRSGGFPVGRFFSSTLRVSVMRVELPSGNLDVIIPPGIAEERTDEHILSAWVGVFSKSG